MAQTFDRALMRLLKDIHCHLVRNGRHPIYYSPISKRNFPVPVGIKSADMANVVLKQAGLPKAF